LTNQSNVAAISKVIWITGASSGVGYETALAFARRGDRVAASARRVDRLDKLVEAAKGLPGEIMPCAGDVTSAADMQRIAAAIMTQWGRLDVLVANAGLGQRGGIVDANWDDLDVVLRTNIDGVLHSVRAAVPLMRKSGGGQIIMISSVMSYAAAPYAAVYSASKSALNTISRSLRGELEGDHIWVTNILLGQTHSEFAEARRGQKGRVVEKLPTMTAAYAAERIVSEVGRTHRDVTLRLLDRLINIAGLYFPSLMDRIMTRVYRVK
jgi:short-subunit dehydrogenase